MLFRKAIDLTKEEIIINKKMARINEYKKLMDLNEEEIVLQNITIKGTNLIISVLTKEYIIIVGKIKEIILNEN